MNKLNLIIILYLVPLETMARSEGGLGGIIFVGLAFLALAIWFNLVIHFIAIPLYIFTFLFKIFNKEVRDGLIQFGVGGFWYTYGIPLVLLITSYPNLGSFLHFTLSALLGLSFWFIIIYIMGSREDSWNKDIDKL